jgi:sulfonate transport system ATP-binding protein
MATHPGGLTEPAPRTTTGAAAGRATGAVMTAGATTHTVPPVRMRGIIRGFGNHRVLDALDLEIGHGEFVALLGRSGSGKSTLLRALAGLDHGVAGSGTVDVPSTVSVVFQDSRLLPWQRVLDNVVLGLDGAPARERARESLAEVGLDGRERAWPNQLSGGEQQRVALARSLVREPELLLADEPFGSLDALTRIRMHQLLRQLCDRHRPAVLLVTHDVDEAIVLADRVVILDHGRIVSDLAVDLGQPRSPADPEFARLRTHLLTTLGIGGGSDPSARDHATEPE